MAVMLLMQSILISCSLQLFRHPAFLKMKWRATTILKWLQTTILTQPKQTILQQFLQLLLLKRMDL